jgi:hypothetical protein
MGARRDEILQVGRGGWISYNWRHGGRPKGLALAQALVRFEESDDRRLEPVELHLPPGDEPLTAGTLRAVPLGRIVAWCNAPEVATVIHEHLGHRVRGLPGPNAFVTMHSPARRSLRIPIPAEPHGYYGDAFYQAVAQAYVALARQVARPAVELAEAVSEQWGEDVEVGSVHSWIKEARKRHFLPPGRKGKAG